MIAEHYLKRWQGAGLIDDAAVERISAWEATHRRPIWLWALSGTGALAIGLGVVAMVAANWEDIPAAVKLSGAMLLTGLVAAFVFVAWLRDRAWPREIGALLLFGLVIASIALIGQVYQLQSEPWQALLTWLALCTPFLALLTFTRLVGTLWFAAAVLTWFSASETLEPLIRTLGSASARGHFFHVLFYLPACLMILVAVVRGLWPPAEKQGELMLKLALAGLTGAVSMTVITIDSRLIDQVAPVEIWLGAVATALAAMALWFGGGEMQRRHTLPLLGVSFGTWAVALLLAHPWNPDGGLEDTITFEAIIGLLFILYWSAIGWLAARTGQRILFGLAFTVIGLRLLVLYFQAIGGLTATGFGLIGGGLLCLALSWLGWRLTQRLARGTPP
ncbi:Uncharacterized membrane protein [Enhydrobacter aerosaccus]|uniref:Uncharacterized membrane protein n=1 Tax=Enhydrobacter aerosaccus TaxID=225324 RepID=A0A1T4R2B8_9HYPH|nr:DUF2157 domain-containing protein [Enhydrobacter aerosaccus]SKA09995.1 Uncharacterized membrane protein [Enhydrobacter aerosaccus]